MSDFVLVVASERRAKRAFAARMKHATAIITTLAYAMLGGSVWEPLFHGQPFGGVHYAFGCVGVALLVGAVYIAPMGEFDHVRS